MKEQPRPRFLRIHASKWSYYSAVGGEVNKGLGFLPVKSDEFLL